MGTVLREPTDHELLKNLRVGREPGLADLYERYSDVLYRYALMVSGSRPAAEEATQDTFVFVIEHAAAFDAGRSASALGWLYGILRNRLRSRLRENAQLHNGSAAATNAAPSAERLFELSGAVDAVASAILDLNIDQREVVVLCGLQELDYATAAEILDVPVGTVRSRLFRARQTLQSALADTTGFELEEVRNGI